MISSSSSDEEEHGYESSLPCSVKKKLVYLHVVSGSIWYMVSLLSFICPLNMLPKDLLVSRAQPFTA